MTDNLKLWRSVEKTDPDHTKRVNQRGGFTSIGAHYQVMRATETFGPVGIGWGYECGEPIFHGPFILIPVTLWHGDRSNTFGPIIGCAEITGNRPDHDAPKKAMTDALTKALSHLGFNADVFLGRFDDNKYVEELKVEKRAEEQKNQPAGAKEEGQPKTPAVTIAEMKAKLLRNVGNHLHPGFQKDLKELRKLDAEAASEVDDKIKSIARKDAA